MDLQFSGDWFSLNIPRWTDVLKPITGKPDIHALEIGSFEGRSACWLLQNVLTDPTSSLTCIDLFAMPDQDDLDALDTTLFSPDSITPASEETFRHNIRAIGADDRVHVFKGSSRMILPTLEMDHFDLIYIDASHLARNVLADGVGSWPLLKRGGLLIFDDYGLHMYKDPADEPKAGIDAFLSLFEHQLDIEHRGYQLMVRKR